MLGVPSTFDMLLGSPHAFISCKLVPCPLFALHVNGDGSGSGKGTGKEKGTVIMNPTQSYTNTHQNQKKNNTVTKLCCAWKRDSTSITNGCCARNAAESDVVTTIPPPPPPPQETSLYLLKRGSKEETININIIDTVHSNAELVSLEGEIDEKELKRRIKISQANKGKLPWNKGRRHSPETIARIKERTKQAMQNPKIRQKLPLVQSLRPERVDSICPLWFSTRPTTYKIFATKVSFELASSFVSATCHSWLSCQYRGIPLWVWKG